MKKFLTILAVAGVMAACNNGSDETTNGDTVSADTTPATVVTPDTTTTGTDTTTTTGTDTTVKK